MKKETKEAALRKLMKAMYDYTTEPLTVLFSETPVPESDEDRVRIILDDDLG